MRRRSIIRVTLLFILGSLPFAAKGALEVQLQPVHKAVLANTSGRFDFILRVRADTAAPGFDGAADQVLVIDRSQSMEGEGKMTHAIAASQQWIEQATEGDRIGLVEFDDRVTVLSELVSPARKQKLLAHVRGLRPRGSTDIHSALMQAIRLLDGAGKSGMRRVLLVSDGMTNTGVTDPREIGQTVRRAKLSGITVSALGLGLDYDEDLLQAIAEHGSGNYHYVTRAEDLEEIFRQERRSLRNLAVRSGEILLLSVAGDTLQRLDLPPMVTGQEAAFLLGVGYKNPKVGRLALGSCIVRYDLPKAETRKSKSAAVEAMVTKNAAEVASGLDKGAQAEALQIEADLSMEKMVARYEKGERKEAKQELSALVTRLEGLNSELKDDRLALKVQSLRVEREGMDKAEQSAAQRKQFLKGSKMRSFYGKKGVKTKAGMQAGDNGGDVARLQEKLKVAGCYQGDLDGKYDESLKGAVACYQKQQGLEVDGVAGPMTMQSLGLY